MILKHSEALSAVNSFHFDFKSWTCNRSSVADGRRAALATMWNWNLWRSKLRKINAIKISFLLWCQAYEVSTGGTPLHCLVGATGSWFVQWFLGRLKEHTALLRSSFWRSAVRRNAWSLTDQSAPLPSFYTQSSKLHCIHTRKAHMILYKSV